MFTEIQTKQHCTPQNVNRVFLHEEVENLFAQNPSPKRTQYLNFNVCYSFIINRVDYKPINMSNFTGMDLASKNFSGDGDGFENTSPILRLRKI